MPDSPADVKTQSTPPTMPPPPPAVSQSTNRNASFTPTTSKSSKSQGCFFANAFLDLEAFEAQIALLFFFFCTFCTIILDFVATKNLLYTFASRWQRSHAVDSDSDREICTWPDVHLQRFLIVQRAVTSWSRTMIGPLRTSIGLSRFSAQQRREHAEKLCQIGQLTFEKIFATSANSVLGQNQLTDLLYLRFSIWTGSNSVHSLTRRKPKHRHETPLRKQYKVTAITPQWLDGELQSKHVPFT